MRGDFDDVGRHRHFHIELGNDDFLQKRDVAIDDMSAILAEMECDARRPAELRLGAAQTGSGSSVRRA